MPDIFVWFPWQLQPLARTQQNSRWEQRIHLCNLMMSFLWSAKPTETWELNRGSCPSALTLQLKFPVDLATGRPIVSKNQQVGGCHGPVGRMFQLIYNRSRVLCLSPLLVNWHIIWIKCPLSFLSDLFTIDFLIADSSNSFWTRSPQATNNSLERFKVGPRPNEKERRKWIFPKQV